MKRSWEANASAEFHHRLGRSPAELEITGGRDGCPDIWQLDNGDIAVIGRDMTHAYAHRLPTDVVLAEDERLVVLPAATLSSAKPDIPDARP